MTISDIPISDIREVGVYCYFKVDERYIKKVESVLLNHEKKFEKVKDKTFGNLIKSFISRIGLWVGLLAITGLMIICSNTVMEINVTGVERVSRDEIIRTVETQYHTPAKKTSFDLDYLEKEIIKIEGVANASIYIKGNVLFIDILEELQMPEILDYSEKTPIKSNYDAVVTKVVTYKGTSVVKAGDTVKKGDILIDAKIIESDNSITETKALGAVYGRIWLSETYVFAPTVIKTRRTGNKQTVYLNAYSQKVPDSPYHTYDVEESLINDYCYFPTKLKKITYYETEEIECEFDYWAERDAIILDKTNELERQIPEGAEKVRTWFSEKTVDKNIILVIYYEIVVKISD